MKKNYIAAAAALCAICFAGCSGSSESSETPSGGGFYTEITPAALTASVTDNEPVCVSEVNSDTGASDPETDGFSCADIAESIIGTVDMSSMAEVGADRLPVYLDFDLPENCDFSMYICGSGGFADEVFVINADGIDVESLKAAAEKRIEVRKKDFEGYNPDEFDKLDNYYTDEVNGYYIYAVTSDNSVCESIFLDFVK